MLGMAALLAISSLPGMAAQVPGVDQTGEVADDPVREMTFDRIDLDKTNAAFNGGTPRGITQGDANDDCKIDGRDIQKFVNIALFVGAPSSEDLCRADFGNNGSVNLDDVSPFVSQLLEQTGEYAGMNCLNQSCP